MSTLLFCDRWLDSLFWIWARKMALRALSQCCKIFFAGHANFSLDRRFFLRACSAARIFYNAFKKTVTRPNLSTTTPLCSEGTPACWSCSWFPVVTSAACSTSFSIPSGILCLSAVAPMPREPWSGWTLSVLKWQYLFVVRSCIPCPQSSSHLPVPVFPLGCHSNPMVHTLVAFLSDHPNEHRCTICLKSPQRFMHSCRSNPCCGFSIAPLPTASIILMINCVISSCSCVFLPYLDPSGLGGNPGIFSL